jgi:DNA-binding transcriptional LysR family regulator
MRESFGLEDVRAFVAIVDLGGFNRAADALAITQSALTRRLQKLEDGIGGRLLDRTTRSVSLTAVGRQFLAPARRMLAQFSDSVAEIRDVIALRGGRVSVSALMTVSAFILPQVTARFRARHPDVRVRVFDATGADIPEHVRRGEAEFAIDMETNEANRDLDFTPLLRDRLVMACHRDHPLAGAGPVRWQKLETLPVVTLGGKSAIGQWLAGRWPVEGGRAGAIEVQHVSTLTAFLEAGLGVGVLLSIAMQAAGATALVYRPLVEPTLERTLGIVTAPGAALSPAAVAYRDILFDAMRPLPGYVGP